MRAIPLVFGTLALVCLHIILAVAFALFFAVSYPIFWIGEGVCLVFDRIKRG